MKFNTVKTSTVTCCQSAASAVAQLHVLSTAFLSGHSLFSPWIIHLPPSLPLLIFPLIKSVRQVPGPTGAGTDGFKALGRNSLLGLAGKSGCPFTSQAPTSFNHIIAFLKKHRLSGIL